MTSWSVCAMVAEPPELLCAFAAHYLEQGAQEVHLYLDMPDADTVALLSGIEGVRITQCTDEFWTALDGRRPVRHVIRQLKVANHAYAQCRSDWFLFCDADEFVVCPTGIEHALAGMPAETLFCRPTMAERVFVADQPQIGLFDGPLRRQLPPRPKLIREVYGDLAGMTTNGLSGHVRSKSFVRTGHADLRIRLHFPVPRDEAQEEHLRAQGKLVPGPVLPGSWLVHFDGMTALHWQLKLLRYYLAYAHNMATGDAGQKVFARRTPARSRQLIALYESRGDAEALARLMNLVRLDPATLDRLRAAGGLVQEIGLDPARAARARVSSDLSLTAADFDAVLHRKYADLIREHGLGG